MRESKSHSTHAKTHTQIYTTKGEKRQIEAGFSIAKDVLPLAEEEEEEGIECYFLSNENCYRLSFFLCVFVCASPNFYGRIATVPYSRMKRESKDISFFMLELMRERQLLEGGRREWALKNKRRRRWRREPFASSLCVAHLVTSLRSSQNFPTLSLSFSDEVRQFNIAHSR